MDSVIFEYLLFITACTGALIGGLVDLKTTEIPDRIPLATFLIALALHIMRAVVVHDASLLLHAFETALVFLVIGYVLFHLGQWGEADVLLLAAIGFAVPRPFHFFDQSLTMVEAIYPLVFLLNLFIAGAIYSIFFALGYALMKQADFTQLIKMLSSKKKMIFIFTSLPIIAAAPFIIFIRSPVLFYLILRQAILFSGGILLLLILLEFARWVDTKVFTQYIPIKRLKAGDVLAEPIVVENKKYDSKLFVGLEEDDIARIKDAYKKGKLRTEKKGYIKIKEGVRYALSFFFALILTWKYGFLLFYLVF